MTNPNFRALYCPACDAENDADAWSSECAECGADLRAPVDGDRDALEPILDERLAWGGIDR